jgi:hypothetical protein
MYVYTIVGAGGFGLGMIIIPGIIKLVFRFPSQDPIMFGIVGCIYVSSGILSIFGLRSPLKFAPILLLQLFYKLIWFTVVLLPFSLTKELPSYVILFAVIFATYIIGDLIAIPFSYFFGKKS